MRTDATLAVAFAVLLVSSIRDANAATDTQRLSSLKTLQASSKAIKFDIATFEEYIENAARPYNVLVFFTADPSMCRPCAQVRKQIEGIAREYKTLSEAKKSSKPTFFAEVKISPSDQAFLRKYQIQHVPIIYLFRASTSRMYPTPLSENSNDFYPIQQFGLAANPLKEFMNTRTGSRFTVVRGGYQIPFVGSVRAAMPLIMSMAIMATTAAITTGAYKSPMLWFGLVVLVYIFSVGGGHYSWIHDVPLAVVNKDGVWEYVASGSRSQYGAEGFFVSATCVSISALVILIQEMPSFIPHKSSQTFLGMFTLFMTLVAIVSLLSLYTRVSLYPPHMVIDPTCRLYLLLLYSNLRIFNACVMATDSYKQ